MFFWIFGLILSLVVALFASQNPMALELRMFAYQFPPVSLTVIILGAALIGALISFFFMGVRVISTRRELKKARKLIEKASQEEAARREQATSTEKETVSEMEQVRKDLEVKQVENTELKKRLELLERQVDDLSETPDEPDED